MVFIIALCLLGVYVPKSAFQNNRIEIIGVRSQLFANIAAELYEGREEFPIFFERNPNLRRVFGFGYLFD